MTGIIYSLKKMSTECAMMHQRYKGDDHRIRKAISQKAGEWVGVFETLIGHVRTIK